MSTHQKQKAAVQRGGLSFQDRVALWRRRRLNARAGDGAVVAPRRYPAENERRYLPGGRRECGVVFGAGESDVMRRDEVSDQVVIGRSRHRLTAMLLDDQQ